ncbi:MAG: putative LPS assembly protein LptD, partial [Blastocatellia bacterium]
MNRPPFVLLATQLAVILILAGVSPENAPAQSSSRPDSQSSGTLAGQSSGQTNAGRKSQEGVVGVSDRGQASESETSRTSAPGAERKPRKDHNGPGESAGSKPPDENTVVIDADSQTRNGDLVVAEGYVNAVWGKLRVQSDRLTFNRVTGDMIAEGNVIYDSGPDERITSRRAEINARNRRGTFWTATGFTDRTETGEYLYFSADRVVKTGDTTYELYIATVTACEDMVPKWSFHSKEALLKINDRVKLYNSVLRVRGIPILVLPYTWLPATKNARKSGFLIPSTGNSNVKGRTFREAYFQTLGDSA